MNSNTRKDTQTLIANKQEIYDTSFSSLDLSVSVYVLLPLSLLPFLPPSFPWWFKRKGSQNGEALLESVTMLK